MSSKSVEVQQQERKARGAALAASGAAWLNSRHDWRVDSNGSTYHVRTDGDGTPLGCDCEDYQRRGELLGTCKHQEAVRITARAHARVEEAGPDKLTGYAVTRLAWEQDAYNRDALKALLRVCHAQQFVGVA